MTLLGKIFTVLILIMSVLFMSFSIMVFATHQNWQKLVDNPSPKGKEPLGLNQQINNAELANGELEKKLKEAQLALKREQVARRFVLASLQSQLDLATKDQTSLEEKVRTMDVKTRNAQTAMETAQENNKGLVKEVKNLREQVVGTQQSSDKYFASSLKLTDEINQLRGVEIRLKEVQGKLVTQVGRMSNVLTKNGLTEFSDVTAIPPVIDGVVTQVSSDIIQISIGWDDGLRKDHELDVYRGKSYLGRIKVRETRPNSAVGEIIPAYRKGTIKQGDRVATKIS
jgi:hypothetical protein